MLERMIEAVHRYEGTVNQVLGGGIMALFGAPLAHENHARTGEEVARALALAERQGERGRQAYARRLAGEIATRREPPDLHAASAAHRDALCLGAELGMRPLVARCHLGLATVHQRIGTPTEARTELDEALERFRGLEMTHWLGRVEALGVAPG